MRQIGAVAALFVSDGRRRGFPRITHARSAPRSGLTADHDLSKGPCGEVLPNGERMLMDRPFPADVVWDATERPLRFFPSASAMALFYDSTPPTQNNRLSAHR
jgi:hypothetical protein